MSQIESTFAFSLVITAFGYLLVPTILYFALKRNLSKPIIITILIVNAILIYLMFAYIRFLGDGYLTAGNVSAAIVWSLVGYFILKKKNDIIQMRFLKTEDISQL